MTVLCYFPLYIAGRDQENPYKSHTQDGELNGVRFTHKESLLKNADWLMVGDSFASPFQTTIPKERRVLFLMEPTNVRRYELDYLMQFKVLVTPTPIDLDGVETLVQNPCLGWFAGTGMGAGGDVSFQFERLSDVKAFPAPKKTRKASMITSLLAMSREHRKRLDFFYRLHNEIGDSIDLFGRDFAPICDKLDGLLDYKYSVVVENCSVKNYWTEKLADAWIAWTLPLYYGDPSILDRIPDKNALIPIDINNAARSVETIKKVLKEDPYVSRIQAIERCRNWVIEQANPFRRMEQIVSQSPKKQLTPPLSEPITLWPAKKVHRPLDEMGEFFSRLLGPQRFEILYYKWRRKAFLRNYERKS